MLLATWLRLYSVGLKAFDPVISDAVAFWYGIPSMRMLVRTGSQLAS